MASKVAIDDLAGMIKRGFDSMDTQFVEVKDRLDRIENLILKKHDREIGDLKLRMQNLEDMLAIPSKK
ncbi:MAG: hypothetical protein Q7S12_03425 [bacterium]|nr:hypothetical protein [bacterium]